MNQEKLSRLVELMNANKIKFSKHFSNALEHGFSDEAREAFFGEVVDEIEAIMKQGVNSEFNKSMRETVAALVEIAVRTGDEGRRTSDLGRLRAETRVCLANMKKTKEYVPEFDLCGNLKDYISSSKMGMEVLENPEALHTAFEDDNKNKCRKLLDEIEDSVNDITDISSSKAVELYNLVMTKLHTWREKIARSDGLYDASAVMTLREALSAMKEWSKIYTSSVLHRGKMKDAYGVPADDLTHAIESVSVDQNIKIFLSHCDEYARKVSGMSNDETANKIVNAHEQIRQVEKEEKDVVARFKANQIYREEAEFALQRLRMKKDGYKSDIARLETDIVSYEKLKLCRNLLLKIENPVRKAYAYVKNNKMHIYALFSGIDFSRLISMINNSVSAEEFAEGIREMQAVMIGRKIIDDQGRIQEENIRRQLALADEVQNENRSSLLDELDNEQQEGSLLDAFLAEEDQNDQLVQENDKQVNKQTDII